MRKYIFLALIALPSAATEVMPFAHSMCLNNISSQCLDGTKLYYTDIGCGCFYKEEFYAPQTCKLIRIKCEPDMVFSSVYKRNKISGRDDYKGCGCFSKFTGMIPLSQ